MVKADQEERIISIQITGKPKTRREFLAVIRAQFDQIHSTISSLEIEEKVPLTEYPQIPPIDYKHLLTLEDLGEENFIPEGLAKRVSVKELLDGIEEERTRKQKSRKNT